MKIAIKRDQFVGIFLIVVGVIYGYMTSKIDFAMTAEYPGPKAFPYIGVLGLIVCGLGIFIQSTTSKKSQPVFMMKEGWLDIFKSFTALILYVIGLNYIGYLISTPILLFFLSKFFAKKIKISLKGRIIFSILTTIVIYIFYVYGFDMQLPVGLLFQ
ncbi:MAG: Tripartite tricarboxylate transporter TctB family protein [Spirochaetes bacterium ADurb.Bin110]|nr:MAG: Tripartite tricarboxylate transporter TctB family protein [Spirochaetes bacterium ADurb.Bin110]